MDINVNLDDIWIDSCWEETIGAVIRDELKACIKLEVRKNIKSNTKLKQLIKDYQTRAIDEAYKTLGV